MRVREGAELGWEKSLGRGFGPREMGKKKKEERERESWVGPEKGKRVGWLGCVDNKKRRRRDGVGLAWGWAAGKRGKRFCIFLMFPNQFI